MLSKLQISILAVSASIVLFLGCGQKSQFELNLNENVVGETIQLLNEEKIISSYWHGSFPIEENVTLDTQRLFEFPDVIDYYINITEGEFESFILTRDSVILVAYSDEVTEQQVTEFEFIYTIIIGGIDTIELITNRESNEIGGIGNLSNQMTFYSDPINLGSLVGGGGGVPAASIWCGSLCCPLCRKTHEIFDIEILDPICCFYCTLCHCC
jgi:hypothetical protein